MSFYILRPDCKDLHGPYRLLSTTKGVFTRQSKLDYFDKDCFIADSDTRRQLQNEMVTVVNCVTGGECQIRRINLGTVCDPSTEAYHTF